MSIIFSRKIDLSNYDPTELVIGNTNGGQLTIQIDGAATLAVKGKHIQSETYVNLGVVNATTFDVTDSITNPGIYNVDISDVDNIKLELINDDKNSEIFIKVVGD